MECYRFTIYKAKSSDFMLTMKKIWWTSLFASEEFLKARKHTLCDTLCFHRTRLVVSVGEAKGISRWLFVTPRSARFFVRRVIPVQRRVQKDSLLALFKQRKDPAVINVRFKCRECKCESGEPTLASTSTRSSTSNPDRTILFANTSKKFRWI